MEQRYISLDDISNLVRNGDLSAEDAKMYRTAMAEEVRRRNQEYMANKAIENYEDCAKTQDPNAETTIKMI